MTVSPLQQPGRYVCPGPTTRLHPATDVWPLIKFRAAYCHCGKRMVHESEVTESDDA